jgi:photosystem II stability/assembly factor-like uncharacterized protein
MAMISHNSFSPVLRNPISKLFKYVIIFAALLIITDNVQSQFKWEWVHPKPSGTTYRWCQIWNTDTFFVAGDVGVFAKTYNGGNNWIVNNFAGRKTGLAYNHIYDAHIFNPQKIIAAGNEGATISLDGGLNFDSIPGLSNTINDIFFLNQNTGYVCGLAGYVKKSTDGGSTWFDFGTGLSGTYRSIHTLNDTLIIISSTAGNIIRTTNGGQNWTQINTGGSGTLYNVRFVNNDTVLVSGSSSVFRISVDGGASWVSRNPPISGTWYNMPMSIEGNLKVQLIGTNDNYALKTTNLGISWDTININFPNQIYYEDFFGGAAINNSDMILAVGTGLINLRKNSINHQLMDGVRFGNLSLTAQNNNGIWVDSTGLNIWTTGISQVPGTTQDQILFSSNGGVNWISQISGNSSAIFYEIQMINTLTGYTVGSGGTFLKTTNGGVNWISIGLPTISDLKSLDFINSNTGWIVGNDSAFYKTTNGGINWIQLFPTFTFGTGVARPKVEFINENTGWVLAASNLNKTTDGGDSWAIQDMNTGTSFAYSICMLDSNIGYISAVGSRLRKTTNGGINWDTLNSPLPPGSQTMVDVNFIDPMNGVILSSLLTMATTDGGQSWIIDLGVFAGGNYGRIKMNKPYPNPLIYLSANGSGVMKLGDVPTGISTTHWFNEVPDNFVLNQNYPNPFNPSTIIEFAIPRQGRVSLKIYDMAGREVRTLINGLELNPGIVKQSFDGSSLASGVYFYSLIVDDLVVGTKKMVLLK